MNEILKNTIERAREQRERNCILQYANTAKVAAEIAIKDAEREKAVAELAMKWLDENLLVMIESAILNGEESIVISRFDWPDGLSYSIQPSMLAKLLGTIDGLTVTLAPSKKMPVFEQITIIWG